MSISSNCLIPKIAYENVDFPSFLAGYNFGRGLFSDNHDKDSAHIVSSRNVTIWKVVDDMLQKQEGNLLFDGGNYIIEWQYDYNLCIGGEEKTELFFFHWKGVNALKGFSPLPAGRNLENSVVERIYQWGEPPVFFHLFPEKLIVLSGNEEEFNPNIPHLMMVRGEIMNELHLYELPCSWNNFRSRTIFFVIIPKMNTIYVWVGSSIIPDLLTYVRRCKKLYTNIKSIHNSWQNFQFMELNEGEDEILKEVLGTNTSFLRTKNLNIFFTPQLYYLIFKEDNINTVTIKNPLRAPNVVSPYPFVQTHLYTATQPGKFKNLTFCLYIH